MKWQKIFIGMMALTVAAAAVEAAGIFKLRSECFEDRCLIPQRNTMTDANLSPELSWGPGPKGVKSWVLICVDHHPKAQRWIHWLVINIPASVTSLPEGASGKLPEGAIELFNTFGNEGYGGPMPPQGSGVHEYHFTIYALNTEKLELDRSKFYGENGLLRRLEGKIIDRSELIGTYSR